MTPGVYKYWQYFVPKIQSGMIELENPQGFEKDKKLARKLLKERIKRKLPESTQVLPYYSLGAAILRERAILENVEVVDKMALISRLQLRELSEDVST